MLSEKEQYQLKRFEALLKMPKWKYVLFTGVLSWGILTALLYSVYNMLVDKVSFDELLRGKLWANLLTFMIAGIFFGLLMHWFLRSQVKRLKEKEQGPDKN